MRIELAVAIALTVFTAAPARAQQAPARRVAFEVVSLKPSADVGIRALDWLPGRFVGRSVPFIGLVNMAYGGGAPVRLEGATALRLSMWDVEATFDPALNPTTEQRAEMLRSMLEDRFRLVLRREMRDTDVYALTVARTDGRLGPQFQASDVPCDGPNRPRFSANLPQAGQRPSCGVMTSIPASAILGGHTVMEPFTRALSGLLQRPIVDRTGLTGTYDIILRFAMNSVARQVSPFDQLPADADMLPSIFVAIREQLGLKLDATRAPVEYQVVECIQEPEPN